MNRAYKYLSESVRILDKDNKLTNLWESVYKQRIEKHNDKQKAIISANARVYSECLKLFIKIGKE